MSRFDGKTNIEIIEPLMLENYQGDDWKSDSMLVFRELMRRGVDHGNASQAIDMAGGGQTFDGKRESSLAFMRKLIS